MGEGYPRVLVDRDVAVVRADDQQPARLRGRLDGHDGPWPRYRVELLLLQDLYTATASDMFEALVRLRQQLEPNGWMIAVQGARRDAYPSGMARDMGGGMKIYVLCPGKTPSMDDLAETLADAPVEQLATVADQRAYWEAWLAESRSRRG